MTLYHTVSQHIIIPVGLHKVARCTRHRRSLPSLLLWQKSSSWRLYVTRLQTWASWMCFSRLGASKRCVGNNRGVVGWKPVPRYPAVLLVGMAALSPVSMKISLNLSLVTARSVLLWLHNSRTVHSSRKTELSISCSSQAVWLGKNSTVIPRQSAAVLQVWCGTVEQQ